MVNVVFQRMEANNPVVPVSPIVVSDILGVPPSALSDTSSVSYAVQTFLNKVIDDFTVTVDPDAFREGLAYAFDSEHGQDAAVDLEDTAESHDREHIEWRGHEQETLKKQGPGMIAPANHAAAGQDKDATEAEEVKIAFFIQIFLILFACQFDAMPSDV